MNYLVQLLVTALAVMVAQYIIPGIQVDSYFTGIIVALILGLLNTFLKPILLVLTLPITVVTLGLFLLVINALLIMLAGSLIDGFQVDGFWWALLFSLILSAVTSIFDAIQGKENV